MSKLARQVKEACLLLPIVKEYVDLKQVGSVWQGLCPFHEETTPSFTLHDVGTVNEHFHCYGCGAHGDVIDFVQRIRGCEFDEAVDFILNYKKRKGSSSLPTTTRKEGGEEGGGKLLQLAHILYQYFLRRQLTAIDIVVNKRHISETTIKEFGLGYLPRESRQDLLKYITEHGFCEEDLFELGIYKEKDGYKWFCLEDRVIFPFFSKEGVIGFAGWNENASKKYVNSSNSPIFKKSNVLFNWFRAKPYIKEAGFVIIVEGYFDVMRLWEAGIRNVVAVCGSSLSKEQANTIASTTDKALLAFDGDAAGKKATEKATRTLQKLGVDVYVVEFPDGEDPDSFLNKTTNREVSLETFCGLEVKHIETERPHEKPQKKRKSVFHRVLELVGKEFDVVMRLGQVYVIPFGEPGKCYLLGSTGCKAYIIGLIIEKLDECPSDNLLRELELYFMYVARSRKSDPYIIGQRRSVYCNGAIYVYIGPNSNKAVKITKDGYSMERIPRHIRFVDIETRHDIPEPEGTDITYLREFITNSLPLNQEIDKLLILSWLLHSILPVKERPFLFLTGSQGVGKTTSAKVLAKIIDDDSTNTCLLSRGKIRSLALNLSKQQAVIFDNLSGIDSETTNVLSAVTQGVSLIVRKLYTNKEVESIQIDPHVSIIITSIGENISRMPDFLERLLKVSLDYPTNKMTRPDKYLDLHFSKLLGGLYTAVSVLMRDSKVISHLEEYSRRYSFHMNYYLEKNECPRGVQGNKLNNFLDTALDTPETLEAQGKQEEVSNCPSDSPILKYLKKKEERESRFSLLWRIMRKCLIHGWLGHFGISWTLLQRQLADTLEHQAMALFNDLVFIIFDEWLRQKGGYFEGFLADIYMELKEKHPDVMRNLYPKDLGNRLSYWKKFSNETGFVIEHLGKKMVNGRRGARYRIHRTEINEVAAAASTLDEETCQELKDILKDVEREIESAGLEDNAGGRKRAANILLQYLKERKKGGKSYLELLRELNSLVILDYVPGKSNVWTSGLGGGANILGRIILPGVQKMLWKKKL